ncbi:hypothetical protein BDW74DRAFT_190015 [Aspergillus multicolor]|uniref:bZIP transcription factor n=1 Tax=Aspergillus multicolor TaxID=41759 RepID=UPI003CCD3AF2
MSNTKMAEYTTFEGNDRSTLPAAAVAAIPLSHMPQQVHVWSADDDWTGVVDRRERRKLQNRQNQRKWRERKKASATTGSRGSPSTSSSSTSTISLSTSTSNGTVQNQDPNGTDILCGHAPPNALEYLRAFEARVRQSYLTNSPDLDHLIGLTRLNVHRAINENIAAIGMTVEWTNCDDSISIFNLSHPLPPHFDLQKIPSALRPTAIQKSTPHHPWLDFFPFPRMRDTLITVTATASTVNGLLFDDEELCHDLMAFWDTRDTQATLLVWGDSWEPRNWEVSEGFARKWGWLLRGCEELLVSTNSWRRRRGERGIDWGRVLGGCKISLEVEVG